MIEMRWVPVKNSQSLSSAYKDAPTIKNDYGEYLVLQYRQRVFVGAYAGMEQPQPNGWSDWIDVPTVMSPDS